MAEKKKWIRDRGLIEIEGKKFPPMLFVLINKKKHYYEVRSYVHMNVLPKPMQNKIRNLLRVNAATKLLRKLRSDKDKARSST